MSSQRTTPPRFDAGIYSRRVFLRASASLGFLTMAGCGGGGGSSASAGSGSRAAGGATSGGVAGCSPAAVTSPSASIPTSTLPNAPAPGTYPAWLSGANVLQWVEIPNTQLLTYMNNLGFTSPGGTFPGVMAWCGGCVRTNGSELVTGLGGHTDYAGNELYSLRLADNAPSWYQWFNPSYAVGPTSVPGSPYNGDGTPAARHSYFSIQFIDARDKVFTFGASAIWGNGNGGGPTVDSCGYRAGGGPLSPISGWDAAGTNPSLPAAYPPETPIVKDASENVWVFSPWSGDVYLWTQSTNSWSLAGVVGVSQAAGEPFAYDSKRNRVFRIADSPSPAGYLDLGNIAADWTTVRVTPALPSGTGMTVYDPVVDCFWFMSYFQGPQAVLYRIDPTSWAVTVAAVTGTIPDNSGSTGDQQFHGRFNYCPELKGLVFMRDATANVFFLRTA